jgi:predicted RNA-binding Zn-ribbon protein involved in translation (DUF1610 family)
MVAISGKVPRIPNVWLPEEKIFGCPKCGHKVHVYGTGHWKVVVKPCPKCGKKMFVQEPSRNGFFDTFPISNKPKIKWKDVMFKKYPMLERAKERAKAYAKEDAKESFSIGVKINGRRKRTK